ncbi:hypothetical protein [Sphingomonas sp. YR710]|uniref:hypothetical protein n=1 Tax=Sphingomonas sp. YR710 TaxID=1882773 RepID=UPI000B84EC48|nr:hypothetical protein [Sphingomonas sp. YR710]
MNAQTTTDNHTTSAADIVIPETRHHPEPASPTGDGSVRPVATPSAAEVGAFFDDLRLLKAACGSKANKHDVAIVLISACIEFGFDTWLQIRGALARLDFNERHVAIVLAKEAGSNPSLHRWWRDEEGRYSLHPELAAIKAAGIEVPALKSRVI